MPTLPNTEVDYRLAYAITWEWQFACTPHAASGDWFLVGYESLEIEPHFIKAFLGKRGGGFYPVSRAIAIARGCIAPIWMRENL